MAQMMIMMMMIMMMVNCFCGMTDRRKAFSLISSQDHCQRSSTSRISDTSTVGLETAENLSSSFPEWSCEIVTTTNYSCLDNSGVVGTTPIDLSKRFVCLPHEFILAKMHAYEADIKRLFKLLQEYPSTRRQIVKLDSIFSSWLKIL